MKKIVSTAAALGLLAGLATTASAVEFKISGSYTAEGIYLDKGNGDGVELNDDNATSDAWYQHTFIIKPTMKVNDKISMGSEIRLADNNVWGNQDDTISAKGLNGLSEIYVRSLYMDYDSAIGKFRVGRVPTGPYGLEFADNDTRANRIMWWPNFLAKPWSTLFYIQKTTENDRYDALGDNESSSDNDHFEARLNYKDANLDGGIRYGYTNANAKLNQTTFALTDTHDDEMQSVSIFGTYKMDNLFVRGELTHNFGNKTASVDYDSWGGMIQAGGKFAALSPSLMYFYASGDTDGTGDDEAFGSTGTEFTPLYILTGRTTGLLNPDLTSGATGTNHAKMKAAGVHAVVLAADYAVSDRLTLHGAIGWAKADDEQANHDDEYGWEYNIGAAYKLLDNLTYEARAGYLDTGDYFKGANQANNTENVYILTHSLTMTF
jgi:hypothetical protein